MANVKCPRCGGVGMPIDTKKKFSFGKALVGGAIGYAINPVGSLIGAATGIKGKNGKTKFACMQCGHVYERKV